MNSLRQAIERAMQAHEQMRQDSPLDEDESAARKVEYHEAMLASGLPRWHWCRFTNLRFQASTENARAIRDFCRSWTRRDKSAVLCGPTGVGKTLCLVALGRRLVIHLLRRELPEDDRRWLKTVRFFRARELAKANREHRLGSGEPPAIQRAVSAGLLLLDDLGNEGDDRDRVLFDVIDRRYMADRPTVLTTHLDEPALCAHYGDALVRRLLDHGTVVSCESTATQARTAR